MPAALAEPVAVRCSFCLKASDEVRTVVAGPGVYICDECVGLCSQLVADHVPSGRPPAPWDAAHSLDEVLGFLGPVARARAQVDATLSAWVATARRLGATWEQVGGALGVTRQSAWERFAGAE